MHENHLTATHVRHFLAPVVFTEIPVEDARILVLVLPDCTVKIDQTLEADLSLSPAYVFVYFCCASAQNDVAVYIDDKFYHV